MCGGKTLQVGTQARANIYQHILRALSLIRHLTMTQCIDDSKL